MNQARFQVLTAFADSAHLPTKLARMPIQNSPVCVAHLTEAAGRQEQQSGEG